MLANSKLISDYADEGLIVIYGAGKIGRSCLKYIGKADYYCDRNAESIVEVSGIPCITLEQLLDKNEKMLVLLALADVSAKEQIKEILSEKDNVLVVDFIDNLDSRRYKYVSNERYRLNINLVYDNDGWILGKFATKLEQELVKLGQNVTLSIDEDPEADINHYISYLSCRDIPGCTDTVRTAMVTHVDNDYKKDLISLQCKHDLTEICMSRDTRDKLISWGIEPSKVCYVNPAHDNEMVPRKIILGITNNSYSGDVDLRKNDELILEVMRRVDANSFKLWIMGRGWETIVEKLKDIGVEVDYYNDFDRDIYYKMMPTLDYWIYYGFDEGAMGYLDALSAGVKTIVTPQGYHLDAKNGMTYACSTIDDFVGVLEKIDGERKIIINSVKDWTWDEYARKHLEIWQYLTRSKSLKELYKHQSEYEDGIFSLLLTNNIVG